MGSASMRPVKYAGAGATGPPEPFSFAAERNESPWADAHATTITRTRNFNPCPLYLDTTSKGSRCAEHLHRICHALLLPSDRRRC